MNRYTCYQIVDRAMFQKGDRDLQRDRNDEQTQTFTHVVGYRSFVGRS